MSMLVIAVMYPATEGASFDHGYYMQTHIPLVRRLWEPLGLTDLRVMRGIPAPDGAAPTYMMTALLTFKSMAAFKAATAQHGPEVLGDISKYTSVSPVFQFNDAVA